MPLPLVAEVDLLFFQLPHRFPVDLLRGQLVEPQQPVGREGGHLRRGEQVLLIHGHGPPPSSPGCTPSAGTTCSTPFPDKQETAAGTGSPATHPSWRRRRSDTAACRCRPSCAFPGPSHR